MRILLLCDPPNHPVSQFSARTTFPVKIISIVLQPLTRTGVAWQRFLSVTIRFVVNMPHLKEDFLPVFIVAFLIQMGIQILKQQRRFKGFNFRKQALINLFQQLCLVALSEHLTKKITFHNSLQVRTLSPAVFPFPWVQNNCVAFLQC